jgi:hypothetical protein
MMLFISFAIRKTNVMNPDDIKSIQSHAEDQMKKAD